ncbi:hypothetical protein RclHR1_00840016 [Rhizophagus clarus]|uniref:Kinase-like domain-containing protein n=1 Tax=Rhizophagus clarus TaxID=94130 RepID=A0A2Z6SBT6_9GLOM|nr:hypothetical protein RclHR1_00840016 [Rhizophagus clarus]GET01115.1 kinase-like domain-containing protein [Rhizophagus clarus]
MVSIMVFYQIIAIRTFFLKREETTQTTLYVSRVVQPTDTNPTLRECVYYISKLAINDEVGDRLGGHIAFDNFSSNDDYNDPDYDLDDSDGDDSDVDDDVGDDDVGLGKRKRKSKSGSRAKNCLRIFV